MNEKNSFNSGIKSSDVGGDNEGVTFNIADLIKIFNGILNSVNSINTSLQDIQNQIHQTNQLIAQSHNIISSQINGTKNQLVQRYMPKTALNFSMELVQHCNLNCAGCDHFSPLAEKKFADFEETSRYFDRLAELFGSNIKYVQFAGGEPLLHPDINKFLAMAREKFPNSPIRIITNGIKLPNMPEDFWRTLKENRVTLLPTKYPIAVDYDAMKAKAESYGIKYDYFNDGNVVKTLFKLPLDFEGLQDENLSFLHCHRANNCIFLQNGRLYTCAMAAIVWRFDKYFGTNLFNEEANSIDIYKAESAEEILKFLARPVPFCRHCKILNTVYDIKWHKSNKAIEEWT